MNMINQNKSQAIVDTTSKMADATSRYIGRVWKNEATQKGVAAASAGILVACVTELLWPSR